jgi:hypothetical protein|tara:strand:- start:311 stop:532 length:222 start_codon:yes stop_codon:yes gene_type:complete
MWNDEQNAADHHADLLRVRARVASEKLQEGAPGQIGTTQQMKEYRLKTLDAMISQAETEMSAKSVASKAEFYR